MLDPKQFYYGPDPDTTTEKGRINRPWMPIRIHDLIHIRICIYFNQKIKINYFDADQNRIRIHNTGVTRTVFKIAQVIKKK